MRYRLVREGLLLRSARPDDATLDDKARLVEEYAIRTVMDLRTKYAEALRSVNG